MQVELYVFEDSAGRETTFTTYNPIEAKNHAASQGLRCIARVFEYSDSEVAWDYTEDHADSCG